MTDLESGQRSLFGGLHDDSVTSGKSRTDLPGNHEKREVPGDDLSTDTEGLVTSVSQVGVVIDLDRLYSLIRKIKSRLLYNS